MLFPLHLYKADSARTTYTLDVPFFFLFLIFFSTLLSAIRVVFAKETSVRGYTEANVARTCIGGGGEDRIVSQCK